MKNILVYVYWSLIFYSVSQLKKLPGLSFKTWMKLTNVKLRAAKSMCRAKEVDWPRELRKNGL